MRTLIFLNHFKCGLVVFICLIIGLNFPCLALVRSHTADETAELEVYKESGGMLEQVQIDGSVLRIWLRPYSGVEPSDSEPSYVRDFMVIANQSYVTSGSKKRIKLCQVYLGEKMVWPKVISKSIITKKHTKKTR